MELYLYSSFIIHGIDRDFIFLFYLFHIWLWLPSSFSLITSNTNFVGTVKVSNKSYWGNVLLFEVETGSSPYHLWDLPWLLLNLSARRLGGKEIERTFEAGCFQSFRDLELSGFYLKATVKDFCGLMFRRGGNLRHCLCYWCLWNLFILFTRYLASSALNIPVISWC